MLSLSQILNSYPQNLGSFRSFILREYLQYQILEIIFESDFSANFCFIGGTCLRLLHENQRFSEDLDFDHFSINFDNFNELAGLIKEKLEIKGYTIEIKTVHKGAYHCYVRFPNILFHEGLSSHANQKILIQIDSESQGFEFKPELIFLNKFEVFCQVACAPKDLLLAHKFSAVLERPRNKGRDFFDIIFLLSNNVRPNYDYLNQKHGIKSGVELKEMILEKCAQLSMDLMAKDVEPFLFSPSDVKKVVLFPSYLKNVMF